MAKDRHVHVAAQPVTGERSTWLVVLVTGVVMRLRRAAINGTRKAGRREEGKQYMSMGNNICRWEP